MRRLRQTLAALLIVGTALAGAVGALALVDGKRSLTAGTIAVGVSPGGQGALDLYVPLVDWGARFGAQRLPARLRVEVRSLDRDQVTLIAQGHEVDVQRLRHEARDAIASYVRQLLVIALVAGCALGGLMALAVRGHHGPRPRLGLLLAAGTSVVVVGLTALLLPPRGRIDDPTYYAHGPDLPRALDALRSLRRSRTALEQELNGQLVGLARLVLAPGRQPELAGRPRLVLASDLHNNVLALPTLERAARGLPLIFAGDLTDKGTPVESSLVRRVARMGRPTVFVSGNHDSDTLQRDLAQAGAIVLTERGRLLPNGRHGPVVVRVGGLRIAGYSDPFLRRAGQDYEDRFHTGLEIAAQEDFRRFVDRIVDQVDVIVVHEPQVAAGVLEDFRRDPPRRPIVILDGHSHRPFVRADPGLLELNAGTIGAGGTGNLADERTNHDLAVLTYRLRPTPLPLAVDQVSIDPDSGSSSARRLRVDKLIRQRP